MDRPPGKAKRGDRQDVDHAGDTHIKYDAYGNIIGTNTPTRFGYTGQEYEGIAGGGLTYMNARYFDPATGSFVSQDPLKFKAGDTNLYRYVGNDTRRRGVVRKYLDIMCRVRPRCRSFAGDIWDQITRRFRDRGRKSVRYCGDDRSNRADACRWSAELGSNLCQVNRLFASARLRST